MGAKSAVSGTFDMDVAVLSALCFLRDRASLEAGGHAVLLALVANAFGRLPLAARQDLFVSVFRLPSPRWSLAHRDFCRSPRRRISTGWTAASLGIAGCGP